MWQPRSVTAMLILLATTLTGCAPTAGLGAPPAPPPRSVPMNLTLSSIADAVLSDAASRTGMEKTALVVESAEPVTWPDGSLGCPEPGMMYTMALVPGYRIRVRAGEQVLDYHASDRGYFVLCPEGRSVEPVDSATG